MDRGGTEVVVYGRRSVREAIDAPRVETLGVHAARSLPQAYRKELTAACREAGIPLEWGNAAAVHALSREPRHDQGVAARIRLLDIMEVEAFADSLTGPAARRPARAIALDGVTNSQNIGMIVRSVVASEMNAMLWPLSGSPWINGLVVKASAGTLFRCPIVRCETLSAGVLALKAAGFRVFALASHDDGQDLFTFEAPHRSLFVVGSETGGLSEEIVELADACLRIPMARGVESLNVAVAASLVCFHRG